MLTLDKFNLNKSSAENRKSAISNQQSAISNQQSAINFTSSDMLSATSDSFNLPASAFRAQAKVNEVKKVSNLNLQKLANKPNIIDELNKPEYLNLSDKEIANIVSNPVIRKKILQNLIDDISINLSKKNDAFFEEQSIDKKSLLLSVENLKKIEKNIPSKEEIKFKGIKYENVDEKIFCHKTIHTHSVICAGITAAIGEGTAVGLDIPLLIATEAYMFSNLASYYKTPPEAAIYYAVRNYWSASSIGMSVLKGIISIAGITGHVTSAGTASVPITAGVRAANSALSASLCEKMGWDFVKSVKEGKMTTKEQQVRLIAYVVAQAISKGAVYEFGQCFDANNAQIIDFTQGDFDNIPAPIKEFTGNCITYLANHGSKSIGERAVGCFAGNLTEVVADARLRKKDISVQDIKQSFKNTIISVIIGEVLAEASSDIVEKNAVKYAENLAKDYRVEELFSKKFNTNIFNDLVTSGKKSVDIKTITDMVNDISPELLNLVKDKEKKGEFK